MPIFSLGKDINFPPVELATEEGVLAIGGDLSPQRLLKAYRQGIFPWYSKYDPILWWSPDPRFILFPEALKVSKSMKKVLKKDIFKITCDTNFKEVIKACSEPRKTGNSTWITSEMIDAYCTLHDLGYAHSVEAWQDDKLAGGLYGISLGSCFFGESMFTRTSNASKACLIVLTVQLCKLGFTFIDCQVYTKHLESLGASQVPRSLYMKLLNEGLKTQTRLGPWCDIFSENMKIRYQTVSSSD